jgi:NADPH:quinone reductase-like Zn-dependent oxidoreductase
VGRKCWCGKRSGSAIPAPERHACAIPPSALNYVDIYVRRGLYPVPLPSGLGYTYEDFVERIETITQGRKLPVVYDSVGKTPS